MLVTGSGGGHGGGRGGGRGSGRRGGSGGGEDVFPVEEQVADLALRVSEGCVGRCRPIFLRSSRGFPHRHIGIKMGSTRNDNCTINFTSTGTFFVKRRLSVVFPRHESVDSVFFDHFPKKYTTRKTLNQS